MQKRLAKAQDFFWKQITAPEGVKEGPPLNDWFKGDKKLSAVHRLNIYADMYFWRIHDAIKEDYPEVFNLIGEKHWNNLMTDYLLQYPSDTPFLQYAGRHLPAFLREYPLIKKWPELYDLARLEWEKAMLFEAPDSPFILLEDLKKIPAEQWPFLRLEWVPAFKLFKNLCIWRQNYAVFHREISQKEQKAITLSLSGKSFEVICEAVGNAEEAAQFLADWVAAECIKRVVV